MGSNQKILLDLTCDDIETTYESPLVPYQLVKGPSSAYVWSQGINSTRPYRNSDPSFPISSQSFVSKNRNTIMDNPDPSFPVITPASSRRIPNSGSENSNSFHPTISRPIISQARGHPYNTIPENSSTSRPMISRSFARRNPNTVQVKPEPYSPITSPAFARGNSDPGQTKSGSFYPTSGLNIRGTKDRFTQQIEEQIRSQIHTPMKRNGSSPLRGQHGVGTSKTNQIEGVSRSTFEQNRPFTSYGLSSQPGNDWSMARAQTYLRDTPQIQKRKGGNDDRSLYQKSFVLGSQPISTKTARNLFKDKQVASLHMKSTDMSELGSSSNTKSPTTQMKTYTRNNKGKSVFIKSEKDCEVNIYAMGKNIQAAKNSGISFDEMEKNYPNGIIDYDSIIKKSLSLSEKEWIFDNSPSFSYVPDAPKLVPVALDNSTSHNDFVSNNNEYSKLSWEENPNPNIFYYNQGPNSVQKDSDNANLVDKITRAVFERKKGEKSNSQKIVVNGSELKYSKSSNGGFHQGLMGNGTSDESLSKAILNDDAIFPNESADGGEGLIYTGNLGELEFCWERINN